MRTLKGPGIMLAQFSADAPPFNDLRTIADWAASLGYEGLQIPAWDKRLFDLETAATSQVYCDEIVGMLGERGLRVTELATHLLGQLVAVHPSYDTLCDAFAPTSLRGNGKARTEWAVGQLKNAVKASKRLGLTEMGTFSGALLWPYFFPFPQRPAEMVEEGFSELAARWLPILNVCDDAGINLCYEIHPSEDLHDGETFELFLEKVGGHARCNILYDPSHLVLQQLKYLDYIDIYHDRIRMFHVKDAEFNPTGRQGVYGGYKSWTDRAGRFRSLGDGQVDFRSIFSKMAQYDYEGWAVLEWECCIKRPEDGAAEGAKFIKSHIINVTDKVFDDFADTGIDRAAIRGMIGA